MVSGESLSPPTRETFVPVVPVTLTELPVAFWPMVAPPVAEKLLRLPPLILTELLVTDPFGEELSLLPDKLLGLLMVCTRPSMLNWADALPNNPRQHKAVRNFFIYPPIV
jgi:hypothetical protein